MCERESRPRRFRRRRGAARCWGGGFRIYIGTSLIRNTPLLGTYSRTIPVVLGRGAVSYERGTPVVFRVEGPPWRLRRRRVVARCWGGGERTGFLLRRGIRGSPGIRDSSQAFRMMLARRVDHPPLGSRVLGSTISVKSLRAFRLMFARSDH